MRPGSLPRLQLAAAVTAATVAAPLAVPPRRTAAVTDPVVVTVTGADVAAAALNRNGLTFKGFGVLSANSTSALLLDYKSQHPDKYWELIETLFGGDHPIMNTVKIEMGNDRNTSTGPNASTMRIARRVPERAARARLPARRRRAARRPRRRARQHPALEPPDVGRERRGPVHLVQEHRARRVPRVRGHGRLDQPRHERDHHPQHPAVQELLGLGARTTPRDTRARAPPTRTTASRRTRRRTSSTPSGPSRPTRSARRRCRSATR